MAVDPNTPSFQDIKEDLYECLEVLQLRLNQAVEGGMKDPGDAYYNEILDLIDDVSQIDSWPQLDELVSKAKTLEVDIDASLARQGVTTVGLQWPYPPKNR